MSVWVRVAAAVVMLSLLSASADATDVSEPKSLPKDTPSLADAWHFQFTPYAWLIFVSGNQQIGSTTSHVDTNVFNIIKNTDHLYAWMSYQELSLGRFSIYNDTVWSRMRFSDTKSGVFPIGPLNQSSVSIVANAKIWLDMKIVESGATYQVANWSSGRSSTAIDLYAGARYWSFQPDITLNVNATVNIPALGLSRTGSGSVSAEKTVDWWDPLVGLRLRYQPVPGQELLVRADIGGFDVGSKFTWQALSAYSFDSSFGTLKWTSYVGYRALSFDYQQDSGNKTIGMDYIIHGPVIGLTFRW